MGRRTLDPFPQSHDRLHPLVLHPERARAPPPPPPSLLFSIFLLSQPPPVLPLFLLLAPGDPSRAAHLHLICGIFTAAIDRGGRRDDDHDASDIPIDDTMEAMRAGRGKGGRAIGHEGHGGCGRKQHGLKEQRMWAGSEVGGDSSAGRQRVPVLRSIASPFSLRRGEAANDREKDQAVEECKQKNK
ncbi:hypothetical protein CFC21_088173 [Triticum aestivum]|uniref:Uncharacterized protein n=3 Tax=Triticum TaxID=4564 RepID=A0A9R0YLP9_TRITD|nr:hypothetical protein CFC21_088173 [Triticum aestivum]VAI57809.1 unnamed protein product [Triticum turgidum subsp. durum]